MLPLGGNGGGELSSSGHEFLTLLSIECLCKLGLPGFQEVFDLGSTLNYHQNVQSVYK